MHAGSAPQPESGGALMGVMGEIGVYTHTHNSISDSVSALILKDENPSQGMSILAVCVCWGKESLKERPCGAPFAKSIRCCFYRRHPLHLPLPYLPIQPSSSPPATLLPRILHRNNPTRAHLRCARVHASVHVTF